MFIYIGLKQQIASVSVSLCAHMSPTHNTERNGMTEKLLTAVLII